MNEEYHKIYNVFERDNKTHKLIDGAWKKKEFEYLQLATWIFTEKVDGTNIRVIWDGDRFEFRGRTDNAQIPAHLLRKLEELFPSELGLSTFGDRPVTLYGEGFGYKIQKGNYLGKDVSFVLFDVKFNSSIWGSRLDCENIATALQISIVPIVHVGSLRSGVEIVKLGVWTTWHQHGPFLAEGFVAKPVCELRNQFGERIICKIKHRDF